MLETAKKELAFSLHLFDLAINIYFSKHIDYYHIYDILY